VRAGEGFFLTGLKKEICNLLVSTEKICEKIYVKILNVT
jgi:hypothetical protein